MSLRNQKCEVYKTKIVTREGIKKANEYYDKFKIKCPVYLDRKTKNLIPSYSITNPLTTNTDNYKEIWLSKGAVIKNRWELEIINVSKNILVYDIYSLINN